MALKVIGGLEITSSATSQNKPLVSAVGNNAGTSDSVIELDTYSSDEMSDIFSVLPLSKYGTNDYLPAGVAGSFEGASANISYRRRSLILEDNGDLVMLRNGTNGSTKNVYYSYLSNALNTTNMSGFVNTNKKYNPAYFNNEYDAYSTACTDKNIIVGLCNHKINGTTHYFISETNNTMDDTVHTGIIVPTSSFAAGVGFAMMDTGFAYIFCMSTDTARSLMYVYTIPRSSLTNSTTVVPTLLSGWTTTSFYNESFSGLDHIVLANNLIATDPATKPYMLIPNGLSGAFVFGGGGLGVFVAKDETTGLLRIRIDGDAYAANIQTSVRPAHAFSYVINIASRTAVLDSGNNAPLLITNNSGSLSASGDLLYSPPIPFANTSYSYYILPNGVSFVYTVGNTANEGQQIIRYNLSNNPISIYDALNVRQHESAQSVNYGLWRASYASPIGSASVGLEVLPNNYCRLYSTDSNSNYRNVLSEYIPPDTYTYKSITYGTLTGFEPSVNRSFIDYGLENRIFISYINQSQQVTTSASILTDYRLSAPISIGSDGLPIGNNRVSISLSILNNFRDAMLSGIPNLEASISPRISLYIPQQAGVPSFAIIQATTTGRGGFFKVVEVTTNTKTSVITNITFISTVYQTVGAEIFGSVTSTSGASNTSVGITIYEGSDFYFIGGVHPYTATYVGNAGQTMFRSKVLKSTGKFSHFQFTGQWSPYTSGSKLPSAFPGLGFGLFDGAVMANDAYTKMIFSSFGTTSADYDAWVRYTSIPDKVIVSQDVPEGFIVYFTQDTPVLINGSSFVLPITNIDLITVKSNPANSTFHVYVILEEGIAKYHITETAIAESGTSAYNVFWIGTVTTNNLQIDSINVNKRARLDIFGAAFEPTGSSFPVSFGLPSQPGTIFW